MLDDKLICYQVNDGKLLFLDGKMFLKNKKDGTLIRVLDVETVINPSQSTISGRIQNAD